MFYGILKYSFVLINIVFLAFTCDSSFNKNRYTYKKEYINGVTFVAPPKPYKKSVFPDLQKLGANWIAVVPYGYHKKDNPNVVYNLSWQWWGETKKGVIQTVTDAKKQHLKVMLKPQIYIRGSFTGNMDWGTDEEWRIWEASFKKYIIDFARIAEDTKVDLFCIGTEYKKAVIKRPKFWRSLIASVREVYSGKLTYAANWDEFSYISFWKELDFIGIDAYFDLMDSSTPSIKELTKAWKKHLPTISNISEKFKKPVLFTEYGYLSVDNCAGKTWEIEKELGQKNINNTCQANAIKALHQVFRKEPYWAGSFLWKWFPGGKGHEGYFDKDYTPQGKEAYQVLKKSFED